MSPAARRAARARRSPAGWCRSRSASDTNGSIRVPASFCGTFGLKPTYGRLSRAGTRPFVASLDHLGPLARTVGDLAASYDAMQGADPDDPACAGRPVEPALAGARAGRERAADRRRRRTFRRLRASPPRRSRRWRGRSARRASSRCPRRRGRAPRLLSSPPRKAPICTSPTSSRARGDFDPMTRDRFLAGALVPAGWVLRAQRFRRWYREQVLALFREVDILLAPATPCPAPQIGQETIEIDGVTVPSRPVHRRLYPAAVVYRPADRRRAAAPAGRVADRRADHRRAVARGRRAARRPGARTRRRHQCGAGAWLRNPRSTSPKSSPR